MEGLMDVYVDYLVSSFGQTTATGLSELTAGQVSHDKITRILSGKARTGKDLWMVVKPIIRDIENQEGVLILDDSICEKPYSDESALICWHYDHSKDRAVKGINFLTAMYHNKGISIPVGYELVLKSEHYYDEKSKTMKRRSPISKNAFAMQLAEQAVKNQIPFRYVLADVWYAPVDNMRFIRGELKKHFIMPIKSNRNVALSKQDLKNERFVKVEELAIKANTCIQIWLEGLSFPLLLAKQVFTNKDGSVGVLYLTTSDINLTSDELTAIYQKRWNIEPFHKSLKQNVSLAKSPAHTPRTQGNHFFAAVCGYVKLEMLKLSTKLNHFALRQRIYLQALQYAFVELQKFRPMKITA